MLNPLFALRSPYVRCNFSEFDSGTPRGVLPNAAENAPALGKIDISWKSEETVEEVCSFPDSGFRHPVRDDTLSDVSEQSLCDCSRGFPAEAFQRDDREVENHTPSRALRHGGRDIYSHTYLSKY